MTRMQSSHTPQSNSICRKSPTFVHPLSALPSPPSPSPLSLLSKQREKMSKISLKNNGLHLLSFFSHSLLLAFLMTSLEKPGGYPLRTESRTTPSVHSTFSHTAHTPSTQKHITVPQHGFPSLTVLIKRNSCRCNAPPSPLSPATPRSPPCLSHKPLMSRP